MTSKIPFAFVLGLALSIAAHADQAAPCVPSGDNAPLASATGASGVKAVVEAVQSDGGVKPAVGVGLTIGSFTGITASVNLFKDRNVDVVFEGFAGVAALSPGYGGGVRAELRPVRGSSNALLVSPGVDVYYVPPIHNSFFSPSSPEAVIVPSVDVKWLHQFAAHFATEIGVRAGYGVALEAGDAPRTMPTVQLITGMRF